MKEEEKSVHFGSSLSNAPWQAKSRWEHGEDIGRVALASVYLGKRRVTSPRLEKCEEGAEDVVSEPWGSRATVETGLF